MRPIILEMTNRRVHLQQLPPLIKPFYKGLSNALLPRVNLLVIVVVRDSFRPEKVVVRLLSCKRVTCDDIHQKELVYTGRRCEGVVDVLEKEYVC